MSLQQIQRKREPVWAYALVLLLAGCIMLVALALLSPTIPVIEWSADIGRLHMGEPTTTTSTSTTTTSTTTTTTTSTTSTTINELQHIVDELRYEIADLQSQVTTTTTVSTTSTTFRVRNLGYGDQTLDVNLREVWGCGLHCVDAPWVQLLENVGFSRKYVRGYMLQWRPLSCIDACKILEKGYDEDEDRELIEIRLDYRNGTLGDILWSTEGYVNTIYCHYNDSNCIPPNCYVVEGAGD